jgi:hypothetical protein
LRKALVFLELTHVAIPTAPTKINGRNEKPQRYMHLLNFNNDEWNCVGATTAKEATKLLEAGFQYVTPIEGVQLFKKRK